jgi:23S rRNA (pseudouridine1915-N3)-methyltransferase
VKLVIVAVGQKMPDWAQTAVDDYAKRFTNDLRLVIKIVKTETRTGQGLEAIFKAERTRIEAVLQTLRNPRIVVLDERGANLTTMQLASKVKDWQLGGDDVALILGGPDGLEPAFKKAAHERIKLSDLTLPHAMARVLLTEALYRAWSVNAGHPYHRE